ncbi:EF-hand domain-containing protein [Sphingosinicella rhizophila]|uniref:EF-hand domain-containing protein n=1 Tax=Sphingosinicella rhizophila TaxID=3050082 RepID=A0ABU3Q4I1_9SPHN|nr:hypothetical protein [Sphingosinicella sp. GR2756]MDT9598325.1 hypothetical protein [Sphingosinicella sp. GR2756]
MRRIWMMLCLAASLGAGGAQAQRRDFRDYQHSPTTIAATPATLAIAGFDRDGDLKVSRAEYDSEVLRSFAIGDQNKDDLLSLIEFSIWAEAVLGDANAIPGPFNFDKDGDDKISNVEFVAEFAKRFGELDKDRDSVLVRSELIVLIDTPLRDRRSRRGGNSRQPATDGPK